MIALVRPDVAYRSAVDALTADLSDEERLSWSKGLGALRKVYADCPGVDAAWLETELARRILAARAARSVELKSHDAVRAGDESWFCHPGRPLYCAYVDRFAEDLKACAGKVDYLKRLGVGFFHPLPLLRCRDGDSDGGFAVTDYRDVDPKLGSFDDLVALAAELRKADIALVLDLVCNHTAREHPWACGFAAGDPRFRDFYIRLDSEQAVDDWSATLGQVFPDTAPGNFTYDADAGGWMWTTFYPFQWDLNYANPRVFVEMLDVVLYLANAGVEGFRLDSAAYLWKRKGTACRNLPETHSLLLALNSLTSLVAPGAFFLAEAIEDIAEVIPFFGATAHARECDMAYNNTPMTALWASLAEGCADIFHAAIDRAAQRPGHGAWLNYARCHDDIIWTALGAFADTDRQKAWSRFFAGETFAKGMAFQAPQGEAPSTCGMAASLCGVGADPDGVARLKTIYSVLFALDGVPMIYMGDEIALTNDTGFLNDPSRRHEIRWLHRPAMDWKKALAATADGTAEHAVFTHLIRLGEIVRAHPFMAHAEAARSLDLSKFLITFERRHADGRVICAANLTGNVQTLALPGRSTDLLTGATWVDAVVLEPWRSAWLTA